MARIVIGSFYALLPERKILLKSSLENGLIRNG